MLSSGSACFCLLKEEECLPRHVRCTSFLEALAVLVQRRWPRGKSGGRMIGKSHRGIWGKQSALRPFEGSLPHCTRQVQGPPSERENRGVQEFHPQFMRGFCRSAMKLTCKTKAHEDWKGMLTWTSEVEIVPPPPPDQITKRCVGPTPLFD